MLLMIDDGHVHRVIDHYLNNSMKLNYRSRLIWDCLLFVYIYEENAEDFGQERIMTSGGLDYSCMRKQYLHCVNVVVACGLRSATFYMLHRILSYRSRVNLGCVCICVYYEENAENFGQEKIMMSGGLD